MGAAGSLLVWVVALAAVPAGAGTGKQADGCFSPITDQDSRELVRLGVSEVVPGAALALPAPGCVAAYSSPSTSLKLGAMGDCTVEFPFPDRPFAPGSPCA